MTFRRLALLTLAVVIGHTSTSSAQVILPRPINGQTNTISPSANRPIGPVRPSSPSYDVGFSGRGFLPPGQPLSAITAGQAQQQVAFAGVALRVDTPPVAPPASLLASRPNLPYPASTQSVITLDNGTRVLINAGTRVLVDPSPFNASRVFVRGLARADGSVVATYVQIY